MLTIPISLWSASSVEDVKSKLSQVLYERWKNGSVCYIRDWTLYFTPPLYIGITISYQYLPTNQPVSWKISKVLFSLLTRLSWSWYHVAASFGANFAGAYAVDGWQASRDLALVVVGVDCDKPRLETFSKIGSRLKSALPCSFISADLRIVSTFARMSPRKSTLPALMAGMINGVQHVLLGNNQVVKKSCLEWILVDSEGG